MDNDKIIMEVPFFQVPNDIFEIGLNKFEMIVYMYLARTGNNGAKSFPSYATIATKCDISKRKAIESVKSLEEKGIIVVERRYNTEAMKNYTNVYNVRHELKKIAGSAGHAPRSEQYAPPSAGDAPIKRTTEQEPYKNNLLTSNYEFDDTIKTFLQEYYNYFGYNHRAIKQHVVFDNNVEVFDVKEYSKRFFDEYSSNSKKHNLEKCSINNFVEHIKRYMRE
jgi:DNA-binding Lrp family transcriptional regulator